MSRTSRRPPINGAQDRAERVQRWTAALLTVLFHMMVVLLVIRQSPPLVSMSAPHGEAYGGRMVVTLTDESLSPPPTEPQPPARKRASPKTPKPSRAIKRALPAPVVQSAAPMPPAAPDASKTSTLPPTEAPEPPATADARPTHVAGQPPGMRAADAARVNAALAAKLGSRRGRNNTAPPVGPDMEVDGFHVYYDLADETRLRAWRDQGMSEVFLPLPGTLRLMVCPLEIVLRRGSGTCRMVEMDSPELKSIGDAREVINMQRVYQFGDMVWSGPGPYR